MYIQYYRRLMIKNVKCSKVLNSRYSTINRIEIPVRVIKAQWFVTEGQWSRPRSLHLLRPSSVRPVIPNWQSLLGADDFQSVEHEVPLFKHTGLQLPGTCLVPGNSCQMSDLSGFYSSEQCQKTVWSTRPSFTTEKSLQCFIQTYIDNSGLMYRTSYSNTVPQWYSQRNVAWAVMLVRHPSNLALFPLL